MSQRFACAALLSLLACCGGSTDKGDAAMPPAGPDAALAGLDAALASADAAQPALDAATAAPDAGQPTLGTISVDDLHTILGNGTKDFLLINVHTPHVQDIPGTDTFIPYTDVDALAAYVGADLDTKVVVYCMGTGMSVPAGNALVTRGYRAVRYLEGGMAAWQTAGYPVVGLDAGP